MADDRHASVRFGPFELDVRSGDLKKRGRRIPLQDQPLLVLQALLEGKGELVTRDELQGRLWPGGTFVDFEDGLNTAVMRLREALGDVAKRPRYVETHLSGRQYVTEYGVALVHAGLGDRDAAFAWLDRALAARSHWLVWIGLDPRWRSLRDDGRFAALLGRVGLAV